MSIESLDSWMDSPRGRYLLAWELQQSDRLVADLFGFHALQIGVPAHDYLRNNRIPFKFRLGGSGAVSVLGCSEELPFASQSLDLVILPHVLEFCADPHQVLREVERVLMPEGSVIIAGFNPYSTWGLRRSLAGNLGSLPWKGQYLSGRRLRDWLSLLGFEARSSHFGCYAPPVASEAWLKRWSFLDSVGERLWPFGGGAYLLHGVKRVAGMRLIAPNWRASLQRKKAMVPVAHRDSYLNQSRNK